MFSMIALAADCANVAVPEATPMAMKYYNSGNILWMISMAWSFIVPILFLVTGFTGKIQKKAEKWGKKKWFFAIAIYLVLFIAITQLLNLPFDFYSDYMRQHEFGLSNQTLSRWFGNLGKGMIVSMICAIAFVWIFYLLLKKSPKKWWFYSAIVSVVLIFFLSFIQPVWIDPVFNDFGPMKDKQLERKILDLANRAGIDDGRVYEVDMSKDTKMLNAYVTGFGHTNRIVLWDTIIEKMPEDQLLSVMGHEMGHYVLHHVWWGLMYFAALSFVVFYLTYKAAHALMRRFSKRFGFKNLYDIASLPLLLFLISVFTFLLSPLSNYVSRLMEHQADMFSLELLHDNEAAAKSFITLQQEDLGNPWPGSLYTFWRASHPSLGERIEFCNHYCPWKDGLPQQYTKYFQNSSSN